MPKQQQTRVYYCCNLVSLFESAACVLFKLLKHIILQGVLSPELTEDCLKVLATAAPQGSSCLNIFFLASYTAGVPGPAEQVRPS